MPHTASTSSTLPAHCQHIDSTLPALKAHYQHTASTASTLSPHCQHTTSTASTLSAHCQHTMSTLPALCQYTTSTHLEVSVGRCRLEGRDPVLHVASGLRAQRHLAVRRRHLGGGRGTTMREWWEGYMRVTAKMLVVERISTTPVVEFRRTGVNYPKWSINEILESDEDSIVLQKIIKKRITCYDANLNKFKKI